jgi:hypothetical protein
MRCGIGPAEAKAILPLPAPMDRGDDRVRVFDNRLVISIARGGRQTGGDVWKGAHCLQRFLTSNPELVSGKRVCELGAGTGYLAMSVHLLGSAQCVLTDKSLSLSAYRAPISEPQASHPQIQLARMASARA